MRVLAGLTALSLLLAAPAQAASIEPTGYLTTETGRVLADKAMIFGAGAGVANHLGVGAQLHRGFGFGEARGHVGFYRTPWAGVTSGAPIVGLSLGGGYKHRLGTWGPFEAAAAGYTGIHLVGRPAVPILLALPMTWGGLTLQPRALLPDVTNLLNGSSVGLTMGLHLGPWLLEFTPAYARDIARLTYQWKTGFRFQMSPTAFWDLQIGNDEFGVGVHPGHPEQAMAGTAFRLVF